MKLLIKDLEKTKLIAVVAIDDGHLAVPLAEALLNGGVHFIEITFRTKSAADALTALKDAGLDIHYGAGTVRTEQQASLAIALGAEFLVSPGFNRNVINVSIDAGIPFIPGVDSTFGIEQAVELNLDVLKFFPAGAAGGTGWLKSIKGPYPELRFIPTGGITLENLESYLALPNVIGIGGSFLATNEQINAKKFDKITETAKKALNIVKSTLG